MEKSQRRAVLSWLFMGALFALCGVLGVLQYRWIGVVSAAAHDRLLGSLRAGLGRLSDDFNSEISAAAREFVPEIERGAEPRAAFLAHYEQARRTAQNTRMFSRIAIAIPRGASPALLVLDSRRGVLEEADWPAQWTRIRERIEARMSLERGRGGPLGPLFLDTSPVLELPLIPAPAPGAPGAPGIRFERRESAWLLLELDTEHAREVVLPPLIQRHLGPEYQVEVLTRTSPAQTIYVSDPGERGQVASRADASVGLLELQWDQFFRRRGPPGMRERRLVPPGPGRGPGPEMGRWQMFVRHRAGSLDAVVSAARSRNLAVTAGVLLLMIASAVALFRSTRRAQRLAELEMDFVAGVSHELRTPLTVIHTAAYNLRGKVAANPGQVERYGALIQQESARLKQLVEQILRFAAAKAGRSIGELEPVSVEKVIEDSLESSKTTLHEAGCVIEKRIDPGLPPVMGDRVALKHAIENLLINAAKYGMDGSNWVGVYASATGGEEQPAVEIRVADHGAGIPEDERDQIFEPFFRGRRALQEQVHGTGLGLSLVKSIVEAHGGAIRVNTQPARGTEFVLWIPAVRQEPKPA
ncbi:MAG: sensor histidine kinase [Bryobacteraceae bacterium]